MITTTKWKIGARANGARRRNPFGCMERLESRDLLSVSVERTSLNLRFSIDNKNPDRPDSEYQTFAVTNNEAGTLNNVWVQVIVANPNQSVQLAPNEDGLYFLGNLDPGETDTAFLYFYGKVVTDVPDPQPFEIKVWKDGPPSTGTEVPVTFTGPDPAATTVFEWVAGSEGDDDGSKTESVTTTYSYGGSPTPGPVVNGTMTMVVTGQVKNNADRILYSPATNRNWPADTFVLDAVQVTYPGATPPDPVALPPDSLFEKPIVGNPKDFVATYTFRIAGTTSTSTPVTARQWTAAGAIGNRKFDHSRLLGTEVPIPPAVYQTALEITKSGTTTAVAGSATIYSYTITVASTGAAAATGVEVADTWPSEFTRQSIVYPPGTTVADTPAGFTWTIGTLATGTSKTLTVNFKVPSTTAPGSYTNTAVVSSTTENPNDPTATATTTVVDVPLTITKSPSVTVVAGSPVVQTFSIVVTNTSGYTAEGVTVTDAWPAQLARQTITPPSGTTITGATTTGFAWNIGTMAPGQSYTLAVKYTVPKATPSGTYTNTATVSSNTANPNPKTASATTTVFDLVLTKSADAPIVAAGSSAVHSFTITVQNTSPTLDLTNAVVNDTWPVPFTIGTFTGPGTKEIIGTNFRWTLPTLARNSSETLTVTYTVPKTTPLTTYTNTATVTSTQGTPVPNAASTTVQVVGVDLTITKVGDAATVKAGTNGHWYRITVTNNSTQFTAENVRVVDTWPVGFTQGSFTGPGTVTPLGGGNFLWTIGNILPGATKQLQVDFAVPAGAALKLYSNEATVSSDTQDPGEKKAQADTLVVAAGVRAGVVICTDDGCDPAWVRVLDGDGNLISQFQPYGNVRGGLRVTGADVNGDGVEEVIVAPGLGLKGPVKVLSSTGAAVAGFPDFYPYGPTWRNGVELAAADINNDGREDLITGMSLGVGTVNVYLVNTGLTLFRSFRGAPAGYAGGVRIGAADFGTYKDGVLEDPSLDGKAEVVVGTNAGITAQVRIFDVQPTAPVLARTIVPFGKAFTGGVSLSTGNYDGDAANIPDILVGAGIGGQSVVKVFNAQTGALVPDGTLSVFSSFIKANAVVNVAPVDSDFDGTIDRLYGVQGRGGAGGTKGVTRVLLPSKSSTPLTTYAPAMRIAPISLSASLMSRAAGRVRVR